MGRRVKENQDPEATPAIPMRPRTNGSSETGPGQTERRGHGQGGGQIQDTGPRGIRTRLVLLECRSRRRRLAQETNGTGAGGMVRGEGSFKIHGVIARGRRRMEHGESASYRAWPIMASNNVMLRRRDHDGAARGMGRGE